ncbi:MAG: LLM class flavin-dependent oxidoreductase [Myxococcota bacterium]|jgi:FMN-dependent oxidoreductase (nitrilotriacetate monooxygenase family)
MQSTASKKMRIGTFLSGTGSNMGSWRHPQSVPDGAVNLGHYLEMTRQAEAAKLDFVFFGDGLYISEKSHPNFLTRFEPLTLLAALAPATSHIGLVATLSTTYSEPFTVARQFGTIDLLSEGRAGWNIVTSPLAGTAANYGKAGVEPDHPDHDVRYRMANEFVDVTEGLWRSWENDAFLRDKERGQFIDPNKLHALNHEGEFFSVAGPLNLIHSRQGQPVLFQAGASEAGRDFAASRADAIFAVQPEIGSATRFRTNLHERAIKSGRRQGDILILQGIGPVVGRTHQEAEDKFRAIGDLVNIDVALAYLGRFFDDIDWSSYDLDAPFPDLGDRGRGGWQSTTDGIKKYAKKAGLTLREVALGTTTPRHAFIGTATKIADNMQTWFEAGAADGFMLDCPVLPTGMTEFINEVVPILVERGLFRDEYEAETLRENLGLGAFDPGTR